MMNATIKQQILAIRDTGLVNMFDMNGVQCIALESEYYELFLFIEENKKDYVRFILTGKY